MPESARAGARAHGQERRQLEQLQTRQTRLCLAAMSVDADEANQTLGCFILAAQAKDRMQPVLLPRVIEEAEQPMVERS